MFNKLVKLDLYLSASMKLQSFMNWRKIKSKGHNSIQKTLFIPKLLKKQEYTTKYEKMSFIKIQ
jgi:hypothetical protein